MANQNPISSIVLTTLAIAISATLCTAQAKTVELKRDYNVKPVPLKQVSVSDDFWTPRLETSRKKTIPYCFEKCEETDRISNFEKAAGLKQGKHEGIYFNDSDVYKVMEGAAYSLQIDPEPKMRQYLDNLIKVMAAAQWEDGYLFTFYSVPERQPEKRWTNIQSIHEQYCVGHMYEAAVAHYEVTGNKLFLDVATKNADLICSVFNPDKRTDPPGHQEIEIGLCKLYRATGDEKYLDQAKFFLDQRGRKGNRGPKGNKGLYGTYSQDHIPVTEQTRAVGHSVRAAYLYTGMADVAALTGNMEYIKAIDAIWKDVLDAKLYITGGIGAAGGHEGFGGAYELPNMTAYCETCASIANIFWNHRMFLMHDDAKYIDVLERILYNAALSGISIKGDRFFYPNPLESIGQHARSPWFGCACCPSNIARFIPSVPGYTYAHKDNNVYVNLFISGDATIETADNKVKLTQQTRYPWKGTVKIGVEPEKSSKFAIFVRIPGWARNQAVPSNLYKFNKASDEQAALKVNGKLIKPNLQRGFARIERKWKKGDTIELNLPMPIRRIIANENIKTNRGKVALQRGPLVFCLEGPDNDGKVLNLMIPDDAVLKTQFRPDLLNGVVVITGKAALTKRTADGDIVPAGEKPFTAIPYYAWAHRGRGRMTVWPARKPEASRPAPADTLTHISKTTASFVHVSLDAIKDQVLPASSSDSSALQLDFWPHKGITEWLKFDWDAEHEISSVKVYWFDDTGRGACKVPESWKVLYRNAEGNFKPVSTNSPYATEKDKFNKVSFKPVKTNALKIEITLQKDWASGVQEVIIEGSTTKKLVD
ncbi:MAG: glycoside hydrolase family 127 protein [Planctomycetes bacterium]|nr:glycoside hydrolase family 127 protein [Planctomycetota bacterium]